MLVQSLLKKLAACVKFFSIISIILVVSTNTTKADFNFGPYQSDNIWDELAHSFTLNQSSNRPEVRSQIKWLLNHQSYLRLYAENSEPYLYYVMQQVKKRNMPGEIVLLPMIESAYNPFASNSGSGAAGLWQLMPGTASGLGIKQNWWFDGRRDIYNSTNAALNHLQYLNTFFNGNWELALAAYDSGEGTVQHAQHRNAHHGSHTNFWSLNLPHETQAYIPRLLALATIIKHLADYHVKLPYIPNQPYFTKVTVDSKIDLPHAAKLAGISYTEIAKLNPGYRPKVAAAHSGTKTIVLPVGKADDFKNSLTTKTNNNVVVATKNKPDHLDKHQFTHMVAKDDSYILLAKKYHVTAAEIHQWNHLASNKPLKLGETLVFNPKQTMRHQTKLSYYRVKSGDSLGKIAKKYKISVKKLARLNHGVNAKRLKPGQKIVVTT